MGMGNYDLDIDGDGDFDFRDAAIRAEIEVGHPEDNADQAWHHALVRIGPVSYTHLTLPTKA